MDRLDDWVRRPHNVRFADLCREAERLGFALVRVRGSHHQYAHPRAPEILTLAPGRSAKARAYQIKQLRDLVRLYGLAVKGDP